MSPVYFVTQVLSMLRLSTPDNPAHYFPFGFAAVSATRRGWPLGMVASLLLAGILVIAELRQLLIEGLHRLVLLHCRQGEDQR
jgi:hypothetical protein